MPNSKLDVSKHLLRRKGDVEPLNDGEALLRSANLISEGFFGEKGITDRQFFEDIGITSEMTRAQIVELLTGLDESMVYAGPEVTRRKIEKILELLRNKGIVGLEGEEETKRFKKLIEYIKQYCTDTKFHDRGQIL